MNGDDFLTKFGNRIEKIGKDGIMGIMKNTGHSINNNIYKNLLFNNDEYHKNLTFKHNRNNIYFENQESNNYSQNKQPKSPFFLDMNYIQANKNRRNASLNNREPLVYSCKMNKKPYQIKNDNNIYNKNIYQNKYEIGDNRQKIIDYGYKPYTIKDYKKVNSEIVMGKLGANLGTKQWNEKRERMKKMSEYGKQLIKGKDHYIRTNESSEEKNKNVNEINENIKWNIINEYSKGLSDNKKTFNKEHFNYNLDGISNEKDKMNNKETNNQGIETLVKQHVNINSRRRLNNLKKILF